MATTTTTSLNTNKCIYISEKKMNVILPENKSKSDFINDYDMWSGDLIALQSDGYIFPELDKKNNKIRSNNDLKKKLQEKKKNNKRAQKEKYNTDKYSRSSDPFYGKTLNERIKLQKQAKEMMKEEKVMKDNRMKEMMEHLSKMSESEQKEYINSMLAQTQQEQ
tara:strand:- start:22 stop:513 length:492 start_codon:yes stop_codon:yes gene_type:complete